MKLIEKVTDNPEYQQAIMELMCPRHFGLPDHKGCLIDFPFDEDVCHDCWTRGDLPGAWAERLQAEEELDQLKYQIGIDCFGWGHALSWEIEDMKSAAMIRLEKKWLCRRISVTIAGANDFTQAIQRLNEELRKLKPEIVRIARADMMDAYAFGFERARDGYR